MSTPIVPVPDVVLASEFPSLADRPAGTYNAKAKAWADSENAMAESVREIALSAQHNAGVSQEGAQAAATAAGDASQAATEAMGYRDEAEVYRDEAAALAGAIGDDAGLPDMEGRDGQVLTVVEQPSGPPAALWKFPPVPEIPVVAIDSDYTLTPANGTNLIEFNGESDATLTFPPASELPNGWYCYVKNRSDADLLMQGEEIGPEIITDGAMESVIGPDVVVNGDFSHGGDWTSTGGWSISAGVATAVSANGRLEANTPPLEPGKWYKATYTVVTRTAGSVRIDLGSMQGMSRSAPGTYVELMLCVGDGGLALQGTSFSGSINNVVVEPFETWKIGGNVFTNPSFSGEGAGWEVGGDGQIEFNDGVAEFVSGSNTSLRQGPAGGGGPTEHVIVFTISDYVSGTITPGAVSGATAVSGNGTYIQYISNPQATIFSTSSFRGKLSNVVLYARRDFSAIPVAYDGPNKEVDFTAAPVNQRPGVSQAIPSLTPGGLYELTYTVRNWSAGGVAARVGAQELDVRSTNGTFTQRFVAKKGWSDLSFAAHTSPFTGSISGVSLRRIDAATGAPDTDQTLAPWRMYPNEARLFYCDGALVRSIVLNAFLKTFTQSDSFIKPPGYARFAGLLWSGGNAGFVLNAGSPSAQGGGGGACLPIDLPSHLLDDIEQVIIGRGGKGWTSTVNLGQAPLRGGDSALADLICYGGRGNDTDRGSSSFIPGVVSTSGLDHSGGLSQNGSAGHSAYGGGAAAYHVSSQYSAGGSSLFGGAGGAATNASNAAAIPGTSYYGGNGGRYGEPGEAPAGGGGAGADGARGELRIWGVL